MPSDFSRGAVILSPDSSEDIDLSKVVATQPPDSIEGYITPHLPGDDDIQPSECTKDKFVSCATFTQDISAFHPTLVENMSPPLNPH